MYIETWYRVNCPACSKSNWLCDGDTSDCTKPDIEAFECWSCRKKHWLDSDCAADYYSGMLEDEDSEHKTLDAILEHQAYAELGREDPLWS